MILSVYEKAFHCVMRERDDLLKPEYRKQDRFHYTSGHCYAVSEALYFLLGGKQAGWVPQCVKHEGVNHWFLKNKLTGQLVDFTSEQFRSPVPYGCARGIGFQNPDQTKPSRRAQVFIDEVEALV